MAAAAKAKMNPASDFTSMLGNLTEISPLSSHPKNPFKYPWEVSVAAVRPFAPDATYATGPKLPPTEAALLRSEVKGDGGDHA